MDLDNIFSKHLKQLNSNFSTPVLYEEIIKNREGYLTHLGPVAIRTGHYENRPMEDKFIVVEPVSKEKVKDLDSKNTISLNSYNNLFLRLAAYMQNREAYVQNCNIGSLKDKEIPISVVTETAWHSLFARNVFRQIHDRDVLEKFVPEFTIIHVPGFQAIPELDGTNSQAFVIINLGSKTVLIGGTSAASEITQTVFTIANYLYDMNETFVMRCAVNTDDNGLTAAFMGASGSGKTTLAIDSSRNLIGDHAHGWSNDGMFNLEWGGHAKLIDLTKDEQPELFDVTRKFGTVMENVSFDPLGRRCDLTDKRLTDNTRATFPITHIPNADRSGVCGHPKHIFLLTCDAFGVIPALAKLTPELAAFAFMSTYSSNFSQSESGELEANIDFKVTYGDTALARPSHEYGNKFLEMITKNNVTCWVMNTGWIGEPYDQCDRIKIEHSKALINNVLSGALDNVEYSTDPVFQYQIPMECPGVPAEVLDPRKAARDEGEYEARANRLAQEMMKDLDALGGAMPEKFGNMLSDIIDIDEDLIDIVDVLGFSI